MTCKSNGFDVLRVSYSWSAAEVWLVLAWVSARHARTHLSDHATFCYTLASVSGTPTKPCYSVIGPPTMSFRAHVITWSGPRCAHTKRCHSVQATYGSGEQGLAPAPHASLLGTRSCRSLTVASRQSLLVGRFFPSRWGQSPWLLVGDYGQQTED